MTMLKVTYLYITTDKYNTCMISGFRHQADKNCTLQSYYAVSRGNFLPAFWDNLMIPSSKNSSLMMGLTVCPETSVVNYPYLLYNNPKKAQFSSIIHIQL